MNVLMAVATKNQDFPVGTVDSQYVFSILSADGSTLESQSVDVPTATFANVADGVYTAQVVKNGVTATQAFTVATAPTTVALAVPDTLTVTLS